jgi:hypothetical protein
MHTVGYQQFNMPSKRGKAVNPLKLSFYYFHLLEGRRFLGPNWYIIYWAAFFLFIYWCYLSSWSWIGYNTEFGLGPVYTSLLTYLVHPLAVNSAWPLRPVFNPVCPLVPLILDVLFVMHIPVQSQNLSGPLVFSNPLLPIISFSPVSPRGI